MKCVPLESKGDQHQHEQDEHRKECHKFNGRLSFDFLFVQFHNPFLSIHCFAEVYKVKFCILFRKGRKALYLRRKDWMLMLESICRDGILGDQDGQGSIEYMILAVAAVVLGFLVFTLIKNVVQGHQGDLNSAWPS